MNDVMKQKRIHLNVQNVTSQSSNSQPDQTNSELQLFNYSVCIIQHLLLARSCLAINPADSGCGYVNPTGPYGSAQVTPTDRKMEF